MAENIVQFGVDIDNRRFVDLNNAGNRPQFDDIIRLFAGEEPVLAGSFVNRSLTAVAFGASDTFEMDIDIDFTHNDFDGTTNAAYSGAVTSIVGTFTADISNVNTSGYITLRKDDGSRESVAYTNLVVSGGNLIGTFTVNKTLTNSYDSGDFVGIQDQLMAIATEADINQGNWTLEDKTAGKLSFELDCSSYSFTEKVTAALGEAPITPDVAVYMEIKRWPSGGGNPVTLLQDVVYARPSVRDVEGWTVPTGPDWTAPDARYQRLYAALPEIGEDLADDDYIYVENTSGGSANRKSLMSRVLAYVQAGITVAASSVSFVNTATQMVATNVQTAIDELFSKFISGRSTSHNYGGTLSINGGDNTKFDVAAGSCDILDSHSDPENPTYTKVSWTAFSAQTVTNLATQPFTVISVKKGTTVPADGELVQTAVAPIGEDRRDYNVLGILIHPTGAFISATKTIPLWGQDTTLVAQEIMESMRGTINRSGNSYSENGANLNIDKSAGEMFGIGYNWEANKKNPNVTTNGAETAITFSLFHRNSAVPAVTDEIDPDFYDPDGTGLVPVPTGWFSTPRLYFDPATGSTIVQYSQYKYDSLFKAVKSAQNEVYAEIAATANFNCRAILAVESGVTTLDDDLERKFIQLGAFGCQTLPGIPTFSRFVESVEVANALSYQRQSITLLESGGTIYADIEAVGGGDIVYPFQQREYTLDCTTGSGAGGKARIALTAGTATVPKKNWVYVTRSGDVAILASSITQPTGEYAMAATALLPDTTTFNSRDAYGSRRWTEAKTLNGRGVIATILSKLRDLPLGYISGLTPVPDFATASEIDCTVASGVVKQIYEQTTDARQVTVNGALVVNDQTTPYTIVTDLADITTDTAGGSLTGNNTYYQLVLAISTNTDGSTQLLVNKPTGSYSTASEAFNDINGYSVTSFPGDFDTVALVCAIVIAVGPGITYSNAATAFGVDFVNLRNVDPGHGASGSGAAAITSFSDAAFSLFNSADSTKLLDLALSAITTTTTRTWTVADKDLTVQGEDSNGEMLLPITGTPTGSAILELQSTTKGFAGPRMTTTQRNAIATEYEGLEIWNTTTTQKEVYNGSTWVAVGPAGSGEANTNTNVGGFAEVMKAKVGVDTPARTVQSSDSSVGITQNTNDLDLKVVKTAPYRTIPFPAGSLTPRETNGAETGTQELATNDINLDYFDFDAATDEAVQSTFMMPDEWDRSTVKFKFIWKDATTAGSGNVVWGVRAVATSNDDALDAAFGTAQSVTDGFITSGDNHTSAATAALTVAGSPALGDLVVFEFYRDADNGSDTYTQDARLIGVAMQYKESSTEPVIW